MKIGLVYRSIGSSYSGQWCLMWLEKSMLQTSVSWQILCFIQFVVSSSGFFSLLFVAFLLYLQRCLESRVLNISRVLKVLKSCVV